MQSSMRPTFSFEALMGMTTDASSTDSPCDAEVELGKNWKCGQSVKENPLASSLKSELPSNVSVKIVALLILCPLSFNPAAATRFVTSTRQTHNTNTQHKLWPGLTVFLCFWSFYKQALHERSISTLLSNKN